MFYMITYFALYWIYFQPLMLIILSDLSEIMRKKLISCTETYEFFKNSYISATQNDSYQKRRRLSRLQFARIPPIDPPQFATMQQF